MNQDTVNDTEWSDAKNWCSLGIAQIYASKRDNRAWVPKRNQSPGYTINFGHKAGAKLLACIVISLIGIVAVSMLLLVKVMRH